MFYLSHNTRLFSEQFGIKRAKTQKEMQGFPRIGNHLPFWMSVYAEEYDDLRINLELTGQEFCACAALESVDDAKTSGLCDI